MVVILAGIAIVANRVAPLPDIANIYLPITVSPSVKLI